VTPEQSRERPREPSREPSSARPAGAAPAALDHDHDDLPGWFRAFAALPDQVRVEQLSRFSPPDGARPRHSAVLILLGEGDRGPDVLLTERAATLRAHAGQVSFPGGGLDPQDAGPEDAALREAAEETGLTDLVPWPDASLRHAAVCYVRPSATEPEHEHADLRYFLATANPDAVAPENEQSPLRWLGIDEARELVGGNNLRHALDRADALFSVMT
jgi:8-oxo-dGTP pyrophosphatase MutT (NUDIX family)